MDAGADMSERTVGGLLAYCDWLREKGYQSSSAIEAWKVAVKKVFATVEPDTYEAIVLDERLDLEDYVRRFRLLAAKQYKAETISVYERRVTNAIEAHSYYIANGKPPAFRSGAQRAKADDASLGTAKARAKQPSPKLKVEQQPASPERYEFSYPLSNGMAHISLPIRLSKRDIDRLTTVLSTLEEQPQIPEHTITGDRMAA